MSCTATLAMLGLFIAMIQNELVFQDVMPDDVGLNLLKMIHTVLTGMALVYIVQVASPTSDVKKLASLLRFSTHRSPNRGRNPGLKKGH